MPKREESQREFHSPLIILENREQKPLRKNQTMSSDLMARKTKRGRKRPVMVIVTSLVNDVEWVGCGREAYLAWIGGYIGRNKRGGMERSGAEWRLAFHGSHLVLKYRIRGTGSFSW
jgi:hypothetical protein